MAAAPATPPAGDHASTTASDRGAGRLGFAGTAPTGATRATGLATLSGDDAGPTAPMLPGSWATDPDQ
ncbi:hypothetical protein BKN37_20965 [Mycobacterium talmoniae]|uniref:PPE-PPW subfamily C-terminal domain-containing protein n=1 Tax=Mycobacterium talmoniae TaxID=1858794 RepID=A0A1S1NGR1_9MYCO|nr:hypothetical protein BKN37_20965 [Mycobacterium talmoniae]